MQALLESVRAKEEQERGLRTQLSEGQRLLEEEAGEAERLRGQVEALQRELEEQRQETQVGVVWVWYWNLVSKWAL